MYDLEPHGNYILCEIVQPTYGEILMPSGEDQKLRPFQRLKVLKVGEGKLMENGTRVPIIYKPGDYVIPHALAEKRFHPLIPMLYGGRQYMLLDAGDIIATVTGEYEPEPPKILTPKQKQLIH